MYILQDLKTYLIEQRKFPEMLLKNGLLLRMACNISAALQHMHEHGFVHTYVSLFYFQAFILFIYFIKLYFLVCILLPTCISFSFFFGLIFLQISCLIFFILVCLHLFVGFNPLYIFSYFTASFMCKSKRKLHFRT